MTIDERLAELTLTLKPWLPLFDDELVQRHLRNALLQVAKDQRHACAEALHTVGHDGILRYEETHQAVMNAEVT